MKTIEVVAAVIIKDGKVYATKRGYGSFKGGWEFPGGKIEPHESKEGALIREIKEELNVRIEVIKHLVSTEYDYPEFKIILHSFISKIVDGELMLSVHSDSKWLSKDELRSVSWLPADIEALEETEKYLIKTLS